MTSINISASMVTATGALAVAEAQLAKYLADDPGKRAGVVRLLQVAHESADALKTQIDELECVLGPILGTIGTDDSDSDSDSERGDGDAGDEPPAIQSLSRLIRRIDTARNLVQLITRAACL